MIICFPHPPGGGGPGSFQIKFEKELQKNGWKVTYAKDNPRPDMVFIVGGTRKLAWLFKMKRKGVPVIYRLDGISWLHRKNKVSIKHYIRAEIMNYMDKCIHAFLSTRIVYQSEFVKDWWDKEGWHKRKNVNIIHNGVFIPEKYFIDKALNQRKTKRLVILEGVIDYSPYAVELLNDLAKHLPKVIQIELYGKFENKQEQQKLNPRLQYKGFLNRKEVYNVLKGSVYLSLDINPACPNTVVEALACGAPVIAFNTGALPELVNQKCGKIVPYGSNPWDLEYPDVRSLKDAVIDIFSDYNNYSIGAYARAKKNYGLQDMFSKYASILDKR